MPAPRAKKPATKKKPVTTAELFARLGLASDWDFALHLPLRYEDETRITQVNDAREGVECQIEVELTHCEIAYRPRRQLVVQGKDSTGKVFFRFLNFYGSQVKQLSPGTRIRAFGEVRQGFFGAEMIHPRYKVVVAGAPLPVTLTPVYPSTAGLSQAAIRRAIEGALVRLGHRLDEETLPERLKKDLKLGALSASIQALHHPAPSDSQSALSEHTHPAWRRIKFDEILAQQLAMRRARAERDAKRAPSLRADAALLDRFCKGLNFRLTSAQHRAFDDIAKDLVKPVPMQRLLQGDVGSGKTVVAALAALVAIGNGFQAAIMAPTEILAEQHHRKLSAMLAPLGIVVTWLTGSLKAREKREAAAAIASGATQLAIGTHALFQDDVTFAKLGLAIIDEQHRFGVGQRLALRGKGAVRGVTEAHQLMMSATPIPRTLSMTYLADLDVSVIDEMPPGREPVTTKLVSDTRRDEVLGRVRSEVIGGAQVYWVCPLIEESESLQLKTATETYERMKAALPELNIGLVHGRLKPAEKNAVMNAFVAREIHVLVATTVIEVGVDVPNASLMIIEHAERMGLSQLHQLRGRVGRGPRPSVCILLFQNPLSENARARLKVIYESTDGFEIAREDLRLRGPGEYLGARQSGAPMLRFADIERDLDLVEAGRNAAAWMVEREPALVEAHMNRWLSSRQHFLKA